MKIAIAGFGVEGAESYKYWFADSANELTIVDERVATGDAYPYGAATMLGPDAFAQLNGYDLVVRTAGLAPQKITTDGKIWSATNEFFSKCPASIIGVTGTKGKGTTSSMVASILEAAGKKVWLVGNIGTASLSVLDQIQPDDWVVYELSSFQLWDIERSPHVAVILPIEAEHLDVHRDFDDYLQAKGNIRKFQIDGDICVYHPGNAYARQLAESNEAGILVPYTASENQGVYVADGLFKQDGQSICETNELQVRGVHNVENAAAAVAVALSIGIDNDAIATGLRNFKGLPHRLEFVREHDGVKYYNDSFSSAVPATIAAVRSFNEPEVLIIGGVDRGGDFEHLAQELSTVENIKSIILIGEIRHKLADLFSSTNFADKVVVFDGTVMQDIVAKAREVAAVGDVVILSPACASFDMFKDFYDRGDQFRREVQTL